ncbi:MAG: nitroreductase family protein [Bacteroidales bacterium]|nr:nitroreductase family protein [Bacteroidales bacterium]
MINIDLEKCNLCGLCIKICHEYCLHIENDILTIDYKYCSTCTQCIAVCPKQALTWDNYKPEPFDKSLYPDSKQVDELFKERRTIRDYTDKKINKSILEEITAYAIYAPTHNFNLRAIIIDDDEIISMIDELIYRISVNIYKWLYKPRIVLWLLKLFVPESEFEFLKAKPKLEKAQERKRGFKTKPAAIILIVGDKRVPLSLESAQYALYNIDLYAQVKGLACRNLVGNQMALNRSKKLRNTLDLGNTEKIFGTITLGYPAIKFRNKVVGKHMDIQWNSIKN